MSLPAKPSLLLLLMRRSSRRLEGVVVIISVVSFLSLLLLLFLLFLLSRCCCCCYYFYYFLSLLFLLFLLFLFIVVVVVAIISIVSFSLLLLLLLVVVLAKWISQILKKIVFRWNLNMLLLLLLAFMIIVDIFENLKLWKYSRILQTRDLANEYKFQEDDGSLPPDMRWVEVLLLDDGSFLPFMRWVQVYWNFLELYLTLSYNRQVNNLLAYAGYNWLSYVVPSFIRFMFIF